MPFTASPYAGASTAVVSAKGYALDLRLQRFDRFPIADDFAVLMVGVAARQASSPAAAQQVLLGGQGGAVVSLLSPANGAFNGATARAIALWRHE